MQLVYADPKNSAIAATLTEGETLGRGLVGPITAFVPIDPANRDYAEIIKKKLSIDPYVAPPPPVPTIISDRQFFQALAMSGLIAPAEALAAVKIGTIPPAMEVFVAQIEDPQAKFAAQMLLSGATQFDRKHPLVEAFGAGAGLTSAQIDDLWRLAATL